MGHHKTSKTSKSSKTTKSSKKSKKEKDEPTRRLRVTREIFHAKLDETMEFLNAEIDKKQRNSEPGVGGLRKVRKRLTAIQRDAKTLLKVKAPVKKGATPRYNALDAKVKVTPALAKFLKLEDGEKISPSDVSRALSTYVYRDMEVKLDEKRKRWAFLNTKGRDLRDPDDKRIIIPDDKLSKLLDYPEYCRQVKKGMVTVKRKDPKYVGYNLSKVKDAAMSRWVLTKLYNKLLIRKPRKPAAKPSKKDSKKSSGKKKSSKTSKKEK